MNEKNLRPFNTLTVNEQREIALMGGEASGKARKYARLVKDIAKEMGDEEIKQKDGKKRTRLYLAIDSMYKEAARGNVSAFLALLKARGEDKQTVEVMQQIKPIILIDDGLGD